MTDAPYTVRWGHDALALEIECPDEGPARLVRFGVPGASAPAGRPDAPLPLVEITAAGHGRSWSGRRYIATTIGERLVYRSHHTVSNGAWHTLVVELVDPATGLVAEVEYNSPPGVAVLRSQVTLRNTGEQALHLESVSSLVVGAVAGMRRTEVLWAENDWLAEIRWRRAALRLTSPVLNGRIRHADGRGTFEKAGQGTWSSCGTLPMGALVDKESGRAWVWQIEHNGGGWRWEAGEREDAAYLALFGPCDSHHGWRHALEPGAAFQTVPAALTCSGSGLDDAFAELTRYRRAIRRPHPDNVQLPVIFNDYMNCLMGDPSTAKLLPLVDAAAEAGAEYFVIDAGWYDDDAAGWWDSVGAWEPSASRFPGPRAIHQVLDHIRDRGMVPGLWLEPEVVGVRSPIAKTLPEEAFFRRDGVRVVEHGRYHLDLRHPAARAHLDQVVDRIVGGWGVGYLKLDYNINPGSGTSADAVESPGAGLLGHNRAQLEWLDAVLDRHPGLVLENCASGGMRMDYALLSRMQLQSTSDQQNLVLYPPIAAAAPTAVTPEQGAVWSYPSPDDSLDEVAFTMATSLLGRMHLSGHLVDIKPEARVLVHEAVDVYKSIRADLAHAVPSWPLGLPGWAGPWIALALRAPAATYLTVWRRPGADRSISIPLPHLQRTAARIEVLYPSSTGADVSWDPAHAALSLTLPTCPSAVVLRITTHSC